MSEWDVLIVGAGHAGAQCAISLRQGGFAGSIAIVGEEPDAPYERPPLSKDYLAGGKDAAQLLLRPPAFWAERDITLITATCIVAIDAEAYTATTSTGDMLGYRHLVWAAGGVARALPVAGGDLAGVHMIRTRAQADALRTEAAAARRIVIVGGGFIGLEAAAVFAAAGRQVALIEAQPRVLARVAAPEVGAFYEAEHRARGVDIRTGATVSFLRGDGRVEAVVLGDGDTLPCDLVIVGIGLVPHQGVLALAGASCGDGVEVDELCRTTLPEVFAIGDCARHVNSYAGGASLRIESVQNAIDMAKTVANAILGAPSPYRSLPWFWSNQYDLKLQTAGLSHGHDATVLRGDPATRSFSLAYFRQGRFVAIDAVNAVADFMAGRLLVEAGTVPDHARLADPAVPLKSLLA